MIAVDEVVMMHKGGEGGEGNGLKVTYEGSAYVLIEAYSSSSPIKESKEGGYFEEYKGKVQSGPESKTPRAIR